MRNEPCEHPGQREEELWVPKLPWSTMVEQIFFPEELQPGEKVHAGAGERHEV